MSGGYITELNTEKTKRTADQAFPRADCWDARNIVIFVVIVILFSILLVTVTKRKSTIHFQSFDH